ncbi:hypothetical protein [Panacagrimonas perspica]|uniref:hypothetical protein n=1 Tax=Panacagrimonas perspica TaxID=381431 RepID=UPI00105D472F|nr:hypothetical protein [Panacagrimonas perspica]
MIFVNAVSPRFATLRSESHFAWPALQARADRRAAALATAMQFEFDAVERIAVRVASFIEKPEKRRAAHASSSNSRLLTARRRS